MRSQATSSTSTCPPISMPERVGPEPFRSILFAEPVPDTSESEAPETFVDLNLDQVVEAITAGRDEYNLKPFFYAPLPHVEAANYRYAVFRDLEDPAIAGSIQSFAQEMRKMRTHLGQADKLHYRRQKQGWFLDAMDVYCGAVSQLGRKLLDTTIGSAGLRAFRAYLAAYIESDEFRALAAETRKLKTDLAGIGYSLHIAGRRVTVSQYGPEPDYSEEVLRTFQKFNQGTAKEHRFEHRPTQDMNHVEAAILDLVAKLFPEAFSSLKEHCARHRGYLNDTIARFDREAQFYFAWLEHVHRLQQAGLLFCYPDVTDRSKEVYGRGVFDLALATKLVREKSPIVPNDFHLRGPERIFVVTGPNQGGKTTFARAFGQLHYLASIGCPVPGTEARLFFCDRTFTHFEKAEDIRNLSGKLEDELRRIHQILERATPNSVLIMNESFLSTTLNDALSLSKKIMRRIVELNMLCVSVTFLDELASFSEAVVSMVSVVDPEDAASRTFKLARKQAEGLAYAAAIAEKYRLTREAVRERIAGNVKRSVTP